MLCSKCTSPAEPSQSHDRVKRSRRRVKPSSAAAALIGFVQQAPTRKAQASMKRLVIDKSAISIDEKAVFIDEKAVFIDEKAVLIDEKFDGRPFFHR